MNNSLNFETIFFPGFQNIVEWFWKGFNKTTNVFLDILLKDRIRSVQLYVKNAQLIEIVIGHFGHHKSQPLSQANTKEEAQNNEKKNRQFFERLYGDINTVLDDTFKKRDLGRHCYCIHLHLIQHSCSSHTLTTFRHIVIINPGILL